MSFFSDLRLLATTTEVLLNRVGRLITQLDRQERQMSQVTNALDRLKKEVREERTVLDSAIAYIKGVPDVVRKAVEDALAANPGLSAEDLGAITDAADELDKGQQDVIAALPANTPEETPDEEPTPNIEAPPEDDTDTEGTPI